MRKQPIKARLMGCLNCASTPEEILNENEELNPYGFVSLKMCGHKEKYFIEGIYKGKVLTPKRIQEKWGRFIKRALWSEISIGTMSNVRVYEYDKNTKQWLLVEQYASC